MSVGQALLPYATPKEPHVARMTREDWHDLIAQSDTLNFLHATSITEMVEAVYGTRSECKVYDFEGDTLGTFTLSKLRSAWTAMADEQGMSGVEWYHSGEPDSIDYSKALEISIAGEVVYG